MKPKYRLFVDEGHLASEDFSNLDDLLLYVQWLVAQRIKDETNVKISFDVRTIQ